MTRGRRIVAAGLAGAVLAPLPAGPLFAGQPSAAPAVGEGHARIEQAGATIDVVLQRPAAAPDRIEARIATSDSASGAPLTAARPLAWLVPAALADPARARDEAVCRGWVGRLARGGLLSPAQAGFNAYRLAAINADGTITVINPQVKLAGEQTEAIFPLDGEVADAVADGREGRLFAALPDRIVRMDVGQRRVATFAPVAGVRHLRWDADNRRLWASGAGGTSVWADVADRAPTRLLHRFAGGDALLSVRSRNLVAVAEGPRVRVIDATTLAERTIAAGGPVRMLAYAERARRLYAVRVDGTLAALAADGRPTQAIAGVADARTIAFAPDGRFALVLRGEGRRAALFDSATDRIVTGADLELAAVEIGFTDDYAYLRSADGLLALLSLRELAEGRISAVTIPLGTGEAQSPGPSGASLGGLVPVPEGSGVLALSGDGGIAYYAEGMMVAMGNLRTHGRRPRGLVLLDQSLHAEAPGRYRAQAGLATGGAYTLVVAMSEPRVAACTGVAIAGPPSPATRAPVRIALADGAPWPAGTRRRLALRIDGAPEGARDARLLVVENDGRWQQRLPLIPTDVGHTYAADLAIPRPGSYAVLVEIPSAGVGFGTTNRLALDVVGAPAP